jgi:hypothetical protein
MEAIRRDLVKQADPAASGLMSRLVSIRLLHILHRANMISARVERVLTLQFEGKMTFTNKCLGCQHVGSREGEPESIRGKGRV